MESYQLKLVQPFTVVLVLVLVPAVAVFSFIQIMIQFPGLSDLVAYTVIYVFLGLLMLLVLWLCVKKMTVDCVVVVDEKGIQISLVKPSLFFKRVTYRGWEDVRAIDDYIDLALGDRVVKIRLANPARRLRLYADNGDVLTIDNFFEALSANRNNFI